MAEYHEELCPINEIRFVQNMGFSFVSGGYEQVTFNSEYTFLYSKTNSDSLPLTAFSVTKAPCLDPARDADFFMGPPDEQNDSTSLYTKVLGDTYKEFHPLELGRFDLRETRENKLIQKCSISEYDDRYQSMPIRTTDIQL